MWLHQYPPLGSIGVVVLGSNAPPGSCGLWVCMTSLRWMSWHVGIPMPERLTRF